MLHEFCNELYSLVRSKQISQSRWMNWIVLCAQRTIKCCNQIERDRLTGFTTWIKLELYCWCIFRMFTSFQEDIKEFYKRISTENEGLFKSIRTRRWKYFTGQKVLTISQSLSTEYSTSQTCNNKPNVAFKCLEFLFRIREVLGSNLVPKTGYTDSGFSLFSPVTSGNFRNSTSNRSRSFPSICFTIHYSLIIIWRYINWATDSVVK